MAISNDPAVAQMSADLGKGRADELAMPNADSRGRIMHGDGTAQDAHVEKVHLQRKQKLERLADSDKLNRLKAWNCK